MRSDASPEARPAPPARSISARFGIGACQLGLALAFVAYVFVGFSLLPAGRGAYRVASSTDLGVAVLLSLVVAAALWAYARRGRGALWILLAALAAVLWAVRYPPGASMAICAGGACPLLLDELVPRLRGWNALGLALLNLVVFAAGTGLALLVFLAALRLLPPA